MRRNSNKCKEVVRNNDGKSGSVAILFVSVFPNLVKFREIEKAFTDGRGGVANQIHVEHNHGK